MVGVVANVSTSGARAHLRGRSSTCPSTRCPPRPGTGPRGPSRVVVRGRGDEPGQPSAPVVREAVRVGRSRVCPSTTYGPWPNADGGPWRQERFGAVLLSSLGASGPRCWPGSGIYGVIAYLREPADPRDRGAAGHGRRRPATWWASSLRQGLKPAPRWAWPWALAGALVAGRALRAVLFGVGVADPVTFLAVAALLLVVAGLARRPPARRAARVDPARALADG